MNPLLLIQNLGVNYIQHQKSTSAVRHVSLEIHEGTAMGLVGESGCGKTTLGLALMGLLPEREGKIISGEILFHGKNLLKLSKEEFRRLRGGKISMIFQDPFSSLNPVLTVRDQIEETLKIDADPLSLSRPESLLEEVQLSDPDRILKSYPHQLSGGQRQRVLIAIALARKPDLLIADEPTTALDVLVQDEIVKLLNQLRVQRHMSMLFITHNIGLIKLIAQELAVMYAGEIVERGLTENILKNPKHPYTQGLLLSLPSIHKRQSPLPTLEGQPPEPGRLPSGCPFHPRCAKIIGICSEQDPSERQVEETKVKCHLY